MGWSLCDLDWHMRSREADIFDSPFNASCPAGFALDFMGYGSFALDSLSSTVPHALAFRVLRQHIFSWSFISRVLVEIPARHCLSE
jgi:hypothetical protein